jgi:hypothetical protein
LKTITFLHVTITQQAIELPLAWKPGTLQGFHFFFLSYTNEDASIAENYNSQLLFVNLGLLQPGRVNTDLEGF